MVFNGKLTGSKAKNLCPGVNYKYPAAIIKAAAG